MTDILNAYQQNKLWEFKGGIHPPEMKQQSNQQPIKKFPIVNEYFIPLVQHMGSSGNLLVKAGDCVKKGQALTRGDGLRSLPIHAPTSGKIIKIAPHSATHPSGLQESCIHLESDGLDQWREQSPIQWENLSKLSAQQLIDRIYNAGIAGLGGAVFPTAAKIDSASDKIKLLIINGAECEPYLTCDDRLMQDYALEILQGISVAQQILQPQKTVIAVEDNKPQAIKVLSEAIKQNNFCIDLRVIPTKYPSGDAKQLTYILTGKEIPKGKRSSSIGALTLNVGTCFAIKRAIFDDEPLIERVVTITGNLIPQPQNYMIGLGTPIEKVLQIVGYKPQKDLPIIVGGPLMGFILQDLSAPITKVSNCLIAPDHCEYDPYYQERSCIRCCSCSDVCPINLLPQELYWFARSENHQKAKDYHLKDCIECGACAYVCPSHIPLVQYFRQEKAKIWQEESKSRKSEEAKARFEARVAREQQAKAERKARMDSLAQIQRQKAQQTEGEDPIAAALERIKAKQTPSIQRIHSPESNEHQAIIAARRARRQANNENKPAPISEQISPVSENNDRKKELVAAAIARAKAKKEAQQNSSTPISEQISPVSENNDRKKELVAAAIARAKAKKEAQQNTSAPISEQILPVSENNDRKKELVAAAIARAKAKKQLKQEEQ